MGIIRAISEIFKLLKLMKWVKKASFEELKEARDKQYEEDIKAGYQLTMAQKSAELQAIDDEIRRRLDERAESDPNYKASHDRWTDAARWERDD